MAREYWPNQSAIGKRVNGDEAEGVWQTVVGVVGHTRSAKPEEKGGPQLYLPYLQHPQGTIDSVVRSTVAP